MEHQVVLAIVSVGQSVSDLVPHVADYGRHFVLLLIVNTKKGDSLHLNKIKLLILNLNKIV